MKNKISIIYLITQFLFVITISLMGKGSNVVESKNNLTEPTEEINENNNIEEKE